MDRVRQRETHQFQSSGRLRFATLYPTYALLSSLILFNIKFRLNGILLNIDLGYV